MTMPPGWREMPGLEAEVRRLAGERAEPETVSLPRRDLDVLLTVATEVLSVAANAGLDFDLTLPGDFTYADVRRVVQRYA